MKKAAATDAATNVTKLPPVLSDPIDSSTKSYYNGLYGTISYYYNVKEGAGSCVTIFPKN